MHINFGLFADILRELASTVGRIPKDDVLHHDQLAQAVTELHRALVGSPAKQKPALCYDWSCTCLLLNPKWTFKSLESVI
jgi:hypothetical protein